MKFTLDPNTVLGGTYEVEVFQHQIQFKQDQTSGLLVATVPDLSPGEMMASMRVDSRIIWSNLEGQRQESTFEVVISFWTSPAVTQRINSRTKDLTALCRQMQEPVRAEAEKAAKEKAAKEKAAKEKAAKEKAAKEKAAKEKAAREAEAARAREAVAPDLQAFREELSKLFQELASRQEAFEKRVQEALEKFEGQLSEVSALQSSKMATCGEQVKACEERLASVEERQKESDSRVEKELESLRGSINRARNEEIGPLKDQFENWQRSQGDQATKFEAELKQLREELKQHRFDSQASLKDVDGRLAVGLQQVQASLKGSIKQHDERALALQGSLESVKRDNQKLGEQFSQDAAKVRLQVELLEEKQKTLGASLTKHVAKLEKDHSSSMRAVDEVHAELAMVKDTVRELQSSHATGVTKVREDLQDVVNEFTREIARLDQSHIESAKSLQDWRRKIDEERKTRMNEVLEKVSTRLNEARKEQNDHDLALKDWKRKLDETLKTGLQEVREALEKETKKQISQAAAFEDELQALRNADLQLRSRIREERTAMGQEVEQLQKEVRTSIEDMITNFTRDQAASETRSVSLKQDIDEFKEEVEALFGQGEVNYTTVVKKLDTLEEEVRKVVKEDVRDLKEMTNVLYDQSRAKLASDAPDPQAKAFCRAG